MKRHAITFDSRKFIDLSNLNLEIVDKLLAESLDGKYQEMNDQTLYLLDITPFKVSPYKTIIIQNCGRLFKSAISSKTLLKDYANYFEANHQETIKVANHLGFYQKIPVIIGNKAIMPSDGYSKKNVSWLVLNQVRHTKYCSSENTIHFYGHHSVGLAISMAKNAFEEQLSRAAQLVQTKITLHSSVMRQYNLVVHRVSLFQRNILADRIDKQSFTQPTFTAEEINSEVLKDNMLDIARDCFEEGDPYLDDFIDKLDEHFDD